ncbi:MAG: hypothetical protein EXS05_22270 [Planctomycetaceae bacterium]|nr:hypothetical protein [Planctomycetaceae bacterium]
MAVGPSATPVTQPAANAWRGARGLLGALLVALGLTLLFWYPLWTGGGLVGGDIYAYFLPQKAFFAEQLRGGSIPVWNNLIGWGYPQVGESQTGVFYPLHWPLYGLLELNTAFNVSLIGHYVLAFAFTWMYARTVGLNWVGAVLAATVYVYGWFPPRVCLEWAILGGAWFPLALWLVERFFATRLWRYPLWLTIVLAVQMLAGHYTLAFVTQLTIVLYTLLRFVLTAGEPKVTKFKEKNRLASAILLAVAAAFGLAAVQLLPTWELKQQSQRQTVSDEHDPGYGYIPPRYLTQVLVPWLWYQDDAAFSDAATHSQSRTNRVEAHLYFGLVPLGLAVGGLWRSRRMSDRRLFIWLPLGLLALIYTTGVLIPVTRYLPGFSFFEGPGRFGLVTTLAVGLWAGQGLSLVWQRPNSSARLLVVIVLGTHTLADLWLVSRQTVFDPWLASESSLLTGPQSKFVYLVDDPPIKHLDESPLRKQFAEANDPVRLFSPGKNLPSLLGVATLPTYLGLGPAAYYDRELMFPGTLDFDALRPPSADQMDWLRRSGVTHLLGFSPLTRLDCEACGMQLVWQASDAFFNRALARPGNAPLYLYRLDETRGRVAWADPHAGDPPRLIQYHPRRVAIEVDAAHEGRLILTDLSYPGWSVTVDRTPAQPVTVEGIFRGVDLSRGKHVVVWEYRSTSLLMGAAASLAMLLMLLIAGHLRFWKSRIQPAISFHRSGFRA